MQRKWRINGDRGTSRWVNSTLGGGWPWRWGKLRNEGWDPEGHCESRECEHQIWTLRLQQHKLNGCWENPYHLRPSVGLQGGSRETWVGKRLLATPNAHSLKRRCCLLLPWREQLTSGSRVGLGSVWLQRENKTNKTKTATKPPAATFIHCLEMLQPVTGLSCWRGRTDPQGDIKISWFPSPIPHNNWWLTAWRLYWNGDVWWPHYVSAQYLFAT